MDFKELQKEIGGIPLSEVIATRIEVSGCGDSKSAACPFCGDDPEERGHFKISDSKGIWKCFRCGESGRAATFIMKYDGVGYGAALSLIAGAFGLSGTAARNVATKPAAAKRRIARPEAQLADEATIDFAYRILGRGESLKRPGSPRLSEAHEQYLLGRGIGKRDMERNGYFTMPGAGDARAVIDAFEKRGFAAEDLLGVPGFYAGGKTGISLCAKAGIGIPIKDADGLVRAVQIRRDAEAGPRYMWLSSASQKERGGVGPGSPADVVYPENMESRTLFITEGHFKADALSKRCSAAVVSVQGVGNWRSAIGDVEKIASKNAIRSICIAFDADMSGNLSVAEHASALAENVSKYHPELKVTLLLWKEENGKGIDDLIANGREREAKRISAEAFANGLWRIKRELAAELGCGESHIQRRMQEEWGTGKKEKMKEKFMKYIFSKSARRERPEKRNGKG